ncbi:SET domain protein [Limihaloglobus sulfuriphilus]|uniref:SET domain protein n=1 Tax=Limihaloglobus sulfuriphilus TaxID=1851148 RepID=A0A1Q2MBF1_9BACT|nr:SET domain-containing protein [Limihaloglobus sulfuriphilus]AQQ70055.1 SET domain protein [Limihaloglobus sulfuriphilus]
MIHPQTTIRYICPEVGIGVFALADIPRGTIVVVRDSCDLCITEQQFGRMPQPLKSFTETYMYHDKDGNLILSWDHAKYMNHSCLSNTMMTGCNFEIAVRDISAGEEITTEYGLLNIQQPYSIDCGAPDCRKIVKADDIDTYGDIWDQLIKESMLLINKVPQPLWPLVETSTKESIKSMLANPDDYISVKTIKWPVNETDAAAG